MIKVIDMYIKENIFTDMSNHTWKLKKFKKNVSLARLKNFRIKGNHINAVEKSLALMSESMKSSIAAFVAIRADVNYFSTSCDYLKASYPRIDLQRVP